WVNLYKRLEGAGYRVRPRYHPEWVGSWVGTQKNVTDCEDNFGMSNLSIIMDDTRVSDVAQVLLRMWHNNERDGPELAVLPSFSDLSRADDPCNHCLPLLDRFNLQTPETFSMT
ncbi:hypothetical protein CALCODRAFT_441581, partial [Calocera cornea HHB12733]